MTFFVNFISKKEKNDGDFKINQILEMEMESSRKNDHQKTHYQSICNKSKLYSGTPMKW